jgi:glycosyltransferase involved in cell wall biosynthesis
MYFAEGILPEIRRDFPGVWLDIVGRNPHPDVLKLASEQRHIRVTGTVEDVRPYMAGATIAIAPLRIARGVQNKVLEALSFGLPVVATMNAYEGIDVVPGRDLLVADTPVEFSSAIVDLLRNPGKRGSLSRSGRTVIESRYSWDATMLNLEHLLLEVCGDTRSKNSRDIVFRG